MPQNIIFGGTQTYRPGVYATVDTSALAGRSLTINRVGVVGNFPFLEQNIPTEVTNAVGLKDLERSSDDMKRLSLFLYNGAADTRVGGGPSAVVLVSINASTQAFAAFKDADGAKAMTLESKSYGVTGNRTNVSAVQNATDTAKQDWTFARDGASETFKELGHGTLVAVTTTSSDVTLAKLKYGPTTGFEITQEFKHTFTANTAPAAGGAGANFAFTDADQLAFGGSKITATVVGGGGAQVWTIRVAGTTQDGTIFTTVAPETITRTGAGVVATSAAAGKGYVKITSIDASCATNESAVITYSNDAFVLAPASYITLGDMADAINADTANHKYAATLSSPKAATFKTAELDFAVAATIMSATINVTGDLQAIVDAINAKSTLVEATRATIDEATGVGTLKPDVPVAGTTAQLASGTEEAAPAVAGYETALAKLTKAHDIQILTVITQSATAHGYLSAHCATMAGTGEAECNGWVGCTENSALTAIRDAAYALNSRHMALVGQSFKALDWNGVKQTYGPEWLAVICMGVQAGTAVATPMTHKYVRMVETIENGWNPTVDANTMISYSICGISRDRIGFRIERSVTTYAVDDNPVFTEVSANESLNTCIRDLRAFVSSRIGDANVAGLAELVRSIALTRLQNQIEDNIIKAFDRDSLDVVDLGDRFRIDVKLAVVEPLNFILINAEVVRNIS